jgi:MFS family permease
VCAVLLAALAFFAGFVTWERRYRGTPLVDLGLFGRRAYRSGILGGLVAFLVMFGLMFVVPFLLENARHTSPASAGLLLTVLPLMLGLVAPFGGRLADRLGPRTLRVGGMACLAAGSGLMAARGGQSPAALVTGLALSGVGLGAFIPANNSSFMASVRTEQSGAASGMINLARGLGTSLGVALTGLVFAAVQGKGAPPAPASVEDGFSAACAMLAGLALLGVAVSAAPTAKARRQPEPRRRRGHLDTGRD